MSRFNVYLIPPEGFYDDTVGAVGSWLGITSIASVPKIRKSVVTVTSGKFGDLREGFLLALESNNPGIHFQAYDVQFDVLTRNGAFAPSDEFMIEETITLRVNLVKREKGKEKTEEK